MTASRIDHFAHRLIEFSYLALFIIVPLILTPFNYELFEFNKMLTVYTATTIITTSWLIRIILQRKILLRRTPFDIPLILFLISQIISTIFSVDPRTSILGYYSRFHGSLLSTVSYITLYYAFVSNLNFNHVLSAIRYLLSAAALVALYAIAQHFGIDKHLWVQDVQTRVFSTLGQPNWLAAYLITIIFLPMALLLHNSKPKNQHLLNFILLFLILLFYLCILYTKSRSGLLGFAIGYAVFWLLVLLKTEVKLFPWRKFLLVTCLLLLVSIFDGVRWLPQVSSIGRATPPPLTSSQLESGGLGLRSLGEGGSESGDIRKIVWKGALKIWRHYPLFGSGVETFAYSYYNFRPPEHNLVSEWDFLYNKAHNEYLNFLATTGVFGLSTYLLLQFWFLIWAIKRSRNHLLIALSSGYIALSASNFFGFSTVPVGLLFFLYPAFAVLLTQNDSK